MDRLDAWLNSQVGWRYTLLVWLQVCPWTVVLGQMIWGFLTFAPELGPMALEVAALSLLAAVPLAGLIVLRRSASIRLSSKPILSWRVFVGTLFLAAYVMSDEFVFAQSPGWGHAHPAALVVSFLLLAVALAFNSWGGHRWRRARRTVPAGRYH